MTRRLETRARSRLETSRAQAYSVVFLVPLTLGCLDGEWSPPGKTSFLSFSIVLSEEPSPAFYCQVDLGWIRSDRVHPDDLHPLSELQCFRFVVERFCQVLFPLP